MKRLISSVLVILILCISAFSLTAFAWETPELMLAADFDSEKQTITVYYRLMKFAGTESADFRLKYNSEALEMTDYTTTEMKDTLVEVGNVKEDDKLAIQFINLYHVKEEDCEEDGSATVATITFKITDTSATEVVFIATADSCAMNPDSSNVSLDRATLKIPLNKGSIQKATSDAYTFSDAPAANEGVRKIIILTIVTAVVFVAGLTAVVIKYRKS